MTTSILTEKQQTLVKPDDDIMFDRKGFDRQGLRQEFAPIRPIQPGQRYVEQGDAMFIDPDSDHPIGDTAVGESMGNIDLVRVTGSTQYIPRYTHGFSLDTEDTEGDAGLSDAQVQDMRDGVLELFDVQADYAFLQGLDQADGATIFKGVFQWLDDNMDSEQIINCNNFNPSGGDLQGVPANIIKQEAYQVITGEYVENQWDVAVAKHPVWARWNQLGTFDGATIEDQWSLVEAEDDADVGVSRRILLPNKIGMRGPPSVGNLRRDITMPTRTNTSYDSPVSDEGAFNDDDDVMYLIPEHNGDFYELREQGTPDHRMLQKEGWQERHEYKWRAGVVQGHQHRTDTDALDAVKLENVTALFD